MTTNFEILKMGKLLGIRNLHILMLDELSLLSLRSHQEKASSAVATHRVNPGLRPEGDEVFLIVNLNKSDRKVNGHWMLAYVDDFQKIFYCPYGSSAPLKVIDYLKGIDSRPILTSYITTQQFDEDICGERCVLIVYLLGKRHRFENIVLSFL